MPIPFDVPVCDPHFHVWDKNHFYNKNLGPIVDGDLGTYTGQRYAEEASAVNLVAAVHVETVVGQKPGGFIIDSLAETKYVVEQCKALAPRPIGIVVYVHLTREDVEAALDAHAAAAGTALLGVRQIMNFRSDGKVTWPQVEHGDYFDGVSPASLAFAQALALLEARDLAFDLHANWFQLEAAAAFLDKHAPAGLRVIVNHSGCANFSAGLGEDSAESRLTVWETGVRALASRPNTYMKISGLEYTYPGWMEGGSLQNKGSTAMVRTLLDAFGSDRCMTASNYPVDKFDTPRRESEGARPHIADLYGALWVLAADTLALPREACLDLFARTAMKAYKIDKVQVQQSTSTA